MIQSRKKHRCVASLKAGLAVMLLVDNRGRSSGMRLFVWWRPMCPPPINSAQQTCQTASP